MILLRDAWRSDGYAVGAAGFVVAPWQETGPSADMDQAAVDRRHTVSHSYRCPVAGLAGAVRALDEGVRPVPPLTAWSVP